MEKVLISSCLLGAPVRYDGRSVPVEAQAGAQILDRWKAEKRLVLVCPEVMGGLSIPRPSAEIQGPGGGQGVWDGSAQVRTKPESLDVSQQFMAGAMFALETVQKWNIRVAILKENSPSCGSSFIYDGTFSRTKLSDSGVTSALLKSQGILVYSENEIESAQKKVQELEA